MKNNDTHAFVNQLLMWLLVTICCSGSIGLGTVWMRYQISITANTNRRIAEEIAKIDRMIVTKSSEVAGEQVLGVLKQRNQAMHLGLVEMNDPQLFRVYADPAQRLVARRTRELLGELPVVGAIRFAALSP